MTAMFKGEIDHHSDAHRRNYDIDNVGSSKVYIEEAICLALIRCALICFVGDLEIVQGCGGRT